MTLEKRLKKLAKDNRRMIEDLHKSNRRLRNEGTFPQVIKLPIVTSASDNSSSSAVLSMNCKILFDISSVESKSFSSIDAYLSSVIIYFLFFLSVILLLICNNSFVCPLLFSYQARFFRFLHNTSPENLT